MVSLWPWKGDNTSPESFEKALSALSAKISASSTKLEGRRQSARRFKALWTLYTSIAYLLYVMIVVLVVGWQNWSSLEYTALAAAPVIIYMGRLVLETYYNYRISRLQIYVNSLQKERDTTISKLKAATKYDSTQQLLEKYGGTPSKPKPKSQDGRQSQPGLKRPQQQQGRTNMAPPPTANIPGRNAPIPLPVGASSKGESNLQSSSTMDPSHQQINASQMLPDSPYAEFAPNAFPTQHYAQASGNKWYDRLMDVMLGEDESNPKNRLALICRKCRLVNGQAPPGIKQLADVGQWRCSACGTMNGEDNETMDLMAKIQQEAQKSTEIEPDSAENVGLDSSEDAKETKSLDSDVTQYTDDEGEQPETIVLAPDHSTEPKEVEEAMVQESTGKRRPGRPKGSTKKKT